MADRERPRNDAILVLGMHRSGTSSVAGVLTLLGASAPKTLIPGDQNNERGYFESTPLNRFHGELIKSAGSSWDDWRAFNPAWYKSPIHHVFEQQAEELFKGEFGSIASPILKDPRICRFAPFWFDVLGKMNIAPQIVIPIRSPLEVARSLQWRDGFPLTKGLLIWLRHILDAEAETRAYPRAIFSWNEFLSDWRAGVERISDSTGIVWPRLSDRTAREIDQFLSRNLKHHTVGDMDLIAHPDVHEWTLLSYEALLTLASEPGSNSARSQLDNVRNAFESACHLFGRVVLDYETTQEAQQADARALQSDRDGWRAQYHHIDAALRQLQEGKEALIAERDALKNQLKASIMERQQACEELATQVARADETANLVVALQAQFQTAATERDQSITKLTQQLDRTDALEAERGALNTKLLAATSELEYISAQLANQAARADDLIAERDALNATMQTMAAELDRVAVQLTDNIAGKNALLAEQEVLRQQLESSLAERDRLAAEPILTLFARRFRQLWR